eukprot:COSAG01_NODE_45643_length_407_cov_1.779221_1_plen_37_part_10
MQNNRDSSTARGSAIALTRSIDTLSLTSPTSEHGRTG